MNTITELVERLRSFAKLGELMEKKTGRKTAVTKALYDAAVMIEELSASNNETHEDEKFTNEELSAMAHGISIKLLSLRSAQVWKSDEKTADEILFLERLYMKIERNLKGV